MSLIRKPFELSVQTTIKALIYGQPGLRKTTLALSAPSPLLLDFDNGVHRVDARHQVDTVQIQSWQDCLDVLNEDLSGYKTLVIDTAGKMLDFMGAYLIQRNPKLGKSNGALSLQGYGERKAEFNAFLRRVSQMGKHLVFVAHEKEEKEGDNKIVRPEIGGSSAGDLIKELDLVGYMQSIGNVKTISFEPCEKFYGKNTCKLPASINLINSLEENKPNDQLAGIFNTYANRLAERQEMSVKYSELLEVIAAKVDSIEDADTAMDAVAWAAQYTEWIWDAQLQAKLRITARTTELGLKYNPKAKKYEQAPVSAAA